MGSDVHSLIGAFHDALLDPGQWSNTLRAFADCLGSSHAILAINGRSPRPPDVVWAGVEQAFQDLYANSFVSGSNPVLLAPKPRIAAPALYRPDGHAGWLVSTFGVFSGLVPTATDRNLAGRRGDSRRARRRAPGTRTIGALWR